MQIDLPSETQVADALERYLAKRGDWVFHEDVFRDLATHFKLDHHQQTALMPNRAISHWRNRVQWARNRLRKEGRFDASRRCFYRLKEY